MRLRRNGYSLRADRQEDGSWLFLLRASGARQVLRRVERVGEVEAERFAQAVMQAPIMIRPGMGGWQIAGPERSVYTADLSSPAKSVVRYLCYRRAAELLDKSSATSCLMIPGEKPVDEINCIKTLLPGSQITAFDCNPVALTNARKAGAHRLVLGDLTRINEPFAPESQSKRAFSVVNMDLCNTIDHPDTPPMVTRLAHRASQVYAVWVSYGHDQRASKEAYRLATGRYDKDDVRPMGRALMVLDLANTAGSRWTLDSVWRYVRAQGGMPMICALMRRSDGGPSAAAVVHVPPKSVEIFRRRLMVEDGERFTRAVKCFGKSRDRSQEV